MITRHPFPKYLPALALVGAMSCAAGAWAQPTNTPDAPVDSVTHTAEVRIVYDPDILRLDDKSIESWLPGELLRSAAPARLSKYQVESASRLYGSFRDVADAPGVMRALISACWVEPPSLPPSDFMAKVQARLAAKLERAQQDALAACPQLLNDWESALHAREDERDMLRSRRQAMYAQTGLPKLVNEYVVAHLTEWTTERDTLSVQLAGLQAKRTALEGEIARIGAAASVPSDEILQELQTVVEFRQDVFNRVAKMTEAGRASTDELGAAREVLAQAKVAVLHHRQELRQQAGGEQLGSLSAQLAQLSVDIAEKDALLSVVAGRLTQLQERDVLRLTDEYECDVAPRLEAAERDVAAARQQVAELQRILSAPIAPQVLIIGEPAINVVTEK